MITDDSPSGVTMQSGDSLQSTADRRQACRHSSILKASRVGGDVKRFTPAWLARVMDISTGGLALHLGEPFEAGTILTIALHNASGQRVQKLAVEVRHAAEQPNGTWILGVAFIEPLSEAQLAALLS